MRAILLVPSSEYAAVLLREGPCGARPPVARRSHVGGGRWEWAPGKPDDAYSRLNRLADTALVLAWEWQPVDVGCDRAKAVLATREDVSASQGLIWTCGSTQRAWVLCGNALGNMIRYADWPIRGEWKEWEREVPALGEHPADVGDLLPAWALATVCEACGLGRVVVLDG